MKARFSLGNNVNPNHQYSLSFRTLRQVVLWEYGAPGEIRTPDPLVRSQVLYPTELRARNEKTDSYNRFSAGTADLNRATCGYDTTAYVQNHLSCLLLLKSGASIH